MKSCSQKNKELVLPTATASWNKRILWKTVRTLLNSHRIKRAPSIHSKAIPCTTEASVKPSLQLSFKTTALCYQALCQPWTVFKATISLLLWELEDRVKTTTPKTVPEDFRTTKTKTQINWNQLIRDRTRMWRNIISEIDSIYYSYIFNN